MAISVHAAAAKAIRTELKKNGIKAKVRSSTYSMGNSVSVTLTEDYLPATVALVKDFCRKFQMGHFNGMEDIYEYSNCREDIPQVKHVMVEIRYSEEIRKEVEDFLSERVANWSEHFSDYDRSRMISDELSGAYSSIGFWFNKKERVAA